MAIIKVDMSQVVANVARSLPRRTDTKRLQAELGAKAMEYWTHLAKTKLGSSSRAYIHELSHRSTENREYIVLTGVLPNMIENGWRGGDMRDWMLKGPKAKTAADGSKYLTVPFRHGTPGTGGRNVGEAMPKPIYNAAKKLDGTKSRAKKLEGPSTLSARSTKDTRIDKIHGKRLEPTMRGISKQVVTMLKTKRQDWHTTSIWTGMQRDSKQYESASQTSGYTTFRRISSKVRPGTEGKSWHHPGIEGKRFAPQVQARIELFAPIIMRQIIEGK